MPRQFILIPISTSLPPFPKKKAFGNMDKKVLEERRIMLDAYLKFLLQPSTLEEYFGLIILMEHFLDQFSQYGKDRQFFGVRKAVGNVKNSVKNVTSAVTSVPNNLIHTVDNVMDGLKGALNVRLL